MTLKAIADKTPLLKQVDTSKVVGLDIGITNLVATSNHKTEENPRFLKRATRNLKRSKSSYLEEKRQRFKKQSKTSCC